MACPELNRGRPAAGTGTAPHAQGAPYSSSPLGTVPCGPLTSRNPSALLTFTPRACSPHLAPARPVPTSPLWFGLLRSFVSIDSRKKSLLTDLLAVSVTHSRAVQVVRALPAGPFPPPGGPEPRSPLVGRGASGVCAWGPAGPLR